MVSSARGAHPTACDYGEETNRVTAQCITPLDWELGQQLRIGGVSEMSYL